MHNIQIGSFYLSGYKHNVLMEQILYKKKC